MVRLLFITFIIILPACGKRSEEERTPKQNVLREGNPNPNEPGSGEELQLEGSSRRRQIKDPVEAIPVETFMVGNSKLPKRIKGQGFEVAFESNFTDVAFECRTGREEGFSECPNGRGYEFKELAHGHSYQLFVRAKTRSGRYDESPIEVRFISDQLGGEAVDPGKPANPDTPRPLPPASASQLPVPVITGGQGEAPAGPRTVLLGQEDLVIVPYHMEVASFATANNLSGTITYFELMLEGSGTCNPEWQRLVTVDAGLTYCESWPTLKELTERFPNAKPVNHVFLTASRSPVDEQLFAASFIYDDELPIGQSWLANEKLCSGSKDSGDFDLSAKPFGRLLNDQIKTFRWCLTKTPGRGWWWVAYFEAKDDGEMPRTLKAFYTLPSGAFGVITPAQFLARARVFLSSVIVPSGQSRY